MRRDKPIRRRLWLVAALSLLAPPPSSASAYFGDFDLPFGLNGVAQPGFEDSTYLNANARAVALQPDGGIVFTGSAFWTGQGVGYNELVVGRLTPSGALDPSFDGDGRLYTGLRPGEGWDMAVQPDGKLVVAGSAGGSNVTGSDIAVVRLHPNGQPDSTFDEDGVQTTDLGAVEMAFALAVQPDGKIIVAGTRFETSCPIGLPCSTTSDMVLIRYLPGGQPDSSFADDGIETIDLDEQDDARGLALQPDGKIVVAGTSSHDTASGHYVLARYLPGGTPDSSFAGDGIQTTPVQGGGARGLALQSDGKLVLPARYGGDFAVARYTAVGELDTSFAGDGIQSLAGVRAGAIDVAFQPDGALVAVGGSGDQNILARFRPDGAPDATRVFSYGSNAAEDLLVQPDGKPVIAGGGVALSIFRFEGGANPPPDRDADGVADPDDRCPDEYTPRFLDPDHDGCPGTSPPPPSRCLDGHDNDGDGRIDFPADTGCTSILDNDESDSGGTGPGAEEDVVVRRFGALRRVKWGVRWTLGCPERCRARVRLLAAGSRAQTSARRVYGSITRTIGAGQTRRVAVRLASRGRRLLVRKGRLRLRVEAALRYSGARHVRSRTLVLTAPRR